MKTNELKILADSIIPLSETLDMLEDTQSPTEVVGYHKVKRVFLPLMEIHLEDPDQLQIYEFKGKNFQLVAN